MKPSGFAGPQKEIVYGTSGWGKSHLLAAFTCFKRRNNVPVVFFPDCKQFIFSNGLNYLRRALISAFANDDTILEKINNCTKENDFSELCQNLPPNTIFIVDQWNALELEGKDDLEFKKKIHWRNFIDSISNDHVLVLGASANNYTQSLVYSKQFIMKTFFLVGGFDNVC